MGGQLLPLDSCIGTLRQPEALSWGNEAIRRYIPPGLGLVLDDHAVVGLVEVAAQIQRRVGQLQRPPAARPAAEAEAGQRERRQGETEQDGRPGRRDGR